MSTAVLDTNVLVSGYLGKTLPGSTPGELIRRWEAKQYTLITSQVIIDEARRTLASPYFERRLSADAIQAAIEVLYTDAVIVPLTASVSGVATHPEDDLVLATAVSAEADYLVTGDRRLQQLGGHRGVVLISPANFLTILSEEQRPDVPEDEEPAA